MNTPARVSLCILCHNRPDELSLAIASANGFDEIIVCDMASEPPLAPIAGVEWIRSDQNDGVCAGRNRLARAATGDIVVFLDDDAVFESPDAAVAIRSAFDASEQPVALAFRVIRPAGASETSEYPFRGATRSEVRRPCAYFVGCGFAVRREDFFDVGGFDDRYVYSTEEIDLALALQRHGATLMYEPDIVVIHSPSPRGRAPSSHIPALRLRNRLLLVRRHLPWPVAIVHVAAWGGRTFIEAARTRGVTEWLHAWRDGLSIPVERQRISFRNLRRIHDRGGRVWW